MVSGPEWSRTFALRVDAFPAGKFWNDLTAKDALTILDGIE
jgi:hypothetical protein